MSDHGMFLLASYGLAAMVFGLEPALAAWRLKRARRALAEAQAESSVDEARA